ncbi:MAG: DUF104 domain-containing protein [Chloroflexi bacterium]|nr:DUF104 domain-containing protein [Chloroflexota bacterium]
MTTTVRATYANGVLTPSEPLELDEGREVTITVSDAFAPDGGSSATASAESLVAMFDRLRASVPADAWSDVPDDFAMNKNHYRCGHSRDA